MKKWACIESHYWINRNKSIDPPRRVLSMIFERERPIYAFIRTVASTHLYTNNLV